MLDSPLTVFSEAIDIRPPLLGVGGGPLLSAAGDNAVTVADAARFGYLLYLQMICTVASTTVGTWTLKDSMGGAVLDTFSQPDPAVAVGIEHCFPFPHPFKTATVNAQFALNFSVATMGTWRVNICGFMSAT
jgi:hypothetical protein